MNYIFELKYPGTSLVLQNPQLSQVQRLLWAMETSFTDSVIALLLFETSQQYSDDVNLQQKWFNRRNKLMEIEKEIMQTEPINDRDIASRVMVGEKAKILLMKRELESGKLPEVYQKRLKFIHAKSFLYSFHEIYQMLKTLKDENIATINVKIAYDNFVSYFPNLNGIRNSSAHKNERIKELPNKKYTEGINVISSECLYGNKFTSTMRDGTTGEVEISIISISNARECVQMAIDSFQWEGFPRLVP